MTTQIKISQIKSIKKQRTANGLHWCASVKTVAGDAFLSSHSLSRLRKRLADRGCTAEQIEAATSR